MPPSKIFRPPKATQFRFIKAKLPSSCTTAEFASLLRDPRVKYVACFRSQQPDRHWVVLAQGRDKFTAKKWSELTHHRLLCVTPVNDFKEAMDDARLQGEFQEHGCFSFCKRKRHSSPNPDEAIAHEPTIMASAEANNKSTIPTGEANNKSIIPTGEANNKSTIPTGEANNKSNPGSTQKLPVSFTACEGARKAYLDAAKSMEERERRMPPFIPSDFEVDIDDMPTTIPRRSAKELLRRGREGARKAALDYIDVLRRAGRLHPNTIPPCLREAAAARLAEQTRKATAVLDKP
jgi:hypothetical protein